MNATRNCILSDFDSCIHNYPSCLCHDLLCRQQITLGYLATAVHFPTCERLIRWISAALEVCDGVIKGDILFKHTLTGPLTHWFRGFSPSWEWEIRGCFQVTLFSSYCLKVVKLMIKPGGESGWLC